jgi:hypothetical protein
MKNMAEKMQARRLLKTRERGGLDFLTFLRASARRSLFFYIYFTFGLMFLSPTDTWASFWFVAFLFFTIMLRDVIEFMNARKSWPFLSKIINWDEVKKISEDEPSA